MRIPLSKKCLVLAALATIFCACPNYATSHVPDKEKGDEIKLDKKHMDKKENKESTPLRPTIMPPVPNTFMPKGISNNYS